MRVRQHGATFLGMLIIVAILAAGAYAGIRLTPLYLEYMKVAGALEQIATQFNGEPVTAAEIRNSLERRWAVEDIKRISPKNMEIHKVGNGTTVRAAYRAEAPFIANISLVVDFDKTIEIR